MPWHQGEITVAALGSLTEPRAPGNEATWTIVKAKFPEEDRNSVQEAAAAARVTIMTEPEEGSGPPWHPGGEFNPQVAFEIINSSNTLSEAGSDCVFRTHNPSSGPNVTKDTSAPASKPSAGGSWMDKDCG